MDEAYGENTVENNRIVYNSRIFISTAGGVVAGVLGLQGLLGLALFALMTFIIAFLFIALKIKHSNGEGHKRFFRSWTDLVLEGLFQGLFVRLIFFF